MSIAHDGPDEKVMNCINTRYIWAVFALDAISSVIKNYSGYHNKLQKPTILVSKLPQNFIINANNPLKMRGDEKKQHEHSANIQLEIITRY